MSTHAGGLGLSERRTSLLTAMIVLEGYVPINLYNEMVTFLQRHKNGNNYIYASQPESLSQLSSSTITAVVESVFRVVVETGH